MRVFQPAPGSSPRRRSRRRDNESLHAISHNQQERGEVELNTLYKKKADKIRPLDTALQDGSMPDRNPNWREDILAEQQRSLNPVQVPGPYDHLFEPRYWQALRGCRITPEQ